MAGSLLHEVTTRGRAVYRKDMTDERYPEEAEFLSRSGSAAASPRRSSSARRAIGMLSLVRTEPDSFTERRVELVALLGRLVATAVQNIRAYEAERATVEELRRLSTLRSDFVSLVSHELRSPMAAVIGSARTLHERWRELSPEQPRLVPRADRARDEPARRRSSADVLDTSRIEAGSFSYAFADVDLGELVQESAAAAESGQDEVRVRATVHPPLPLVRGDRERLRQVLANLIDNAVKYSPAGGEVEIEALARNGTIDRRGARPRARASHPSITR